jgi:hypothetical protein
MKMSAAAAIAPSAISTQAHAGSPLLSEERGLADTLVVLLVTFALADVVFVTVRVFVGPVTVDVFVAVVVLGGAWLVEVETVVVVVVVVTVVCVPLVMVAAAS